MSREETPSGPLDVASLQVLARRASDHPLVDDWAFQPDERSPRRLEVRIDAAQFPASVDGVRLDVRWFEGGDYCVHYRERGDGEDWECRWDRHPKPDGPRTHFHPPPDAAPVVEESNLDDVHHLGVLFSVLDWVTERVEQHDWS